METLNKNTYYADQLNQINAHALYSPQVQVRDENGATKWLSLNNESAAELVKWLKKNYPAIAPKKTPQPKGAIVTSQDVIVNFRNYGEITVPKGTRLTNKTAMGVDKEEKYFFVEDFKWMYRDYPEYANILEHDAAYYGINIPKKYIETL